MKQDKSTPAIRRRVPGVIPDVPGKELRPHMRDADPERGVLKHVPLTPQTVQNFGGGTDGYWKGRDVASKATFFGKMGKSPAPEVDPFENIPAVAVRTPN